MKELLQETETNDLPPENGTMAYVKKEVLNHEAVWGIYSSFGEKMGQASSREIAVALVQQNDLTPHSVH